MCIHVSKAHDLVAEMAFRCSPSIGEFVWRKPGEQEFGICRLVWIAFLWNLQVTETAED
jgi:hypothetical protein